MDKIIQKIKQDQYIQIGANIRNLRMEQNLTQEEMTRILQLAGISISRSTYAKIEMGTHHIAATTLEVIRDALHTTYDELLKHTS